MIHFILTMLIASAFVWGGTALLELNGFLLCLYLAAALVAGWFLQTDEEREATKKWWHERL